jgi:hypothetical protein
MGRGGGCDGCSGDSLSNDGDGGGDGDGVVDGVVGVARELLVPSEEEDEFPSSRSRDSCHPLSLS